MGRNLLPSLGCWTSAALVVLASPPYDVPGLELVAWVPLLAAALSGSRHRALTDGLWWALLTGILCVWWIAPAVHSVLVLDPVTAGFAVMGTGTLVALPAAPWGWCLQRARQRLPLGLAPAVVAGVGMLASLLLTCPIPHALALLAHDLPVRGLVAGLGSAGLVGLLAWVNSALALAWHHRSVARHRAMASASAVAALLLAAGATVGLRPGDPTASWDVGVVQASRSTDEVERARAGDDAAADELLGAYRDLSDPLVSAVDLLVWPETVYPGVWRRPYSRPQQQRQLAFDRWVDEGTAAVLVGTWSQDEDAVDDRLYNAVVALTPDPVDPGPPATSIYRKHVLLPLAEDVPWTTYDDTSRKRYPFSAFFLHGPEPTPLRVEGVPVGVSICFEDLQPWIGRRHVDLGAELLVNVANDGWFPRHGEPQWHLAAAKMRATETGRAMVRATNDGISAVIDADGTLLDKLPSGAADTMVVSVPLHRAATPYVRFGSWPAALVGLLLALGLLAPPREGRDAS